MFIDASGAMGSEHARDLRRIAAAYRLGHLDRPRSGLREFVARGHLGPVRNYRAC